MSSSVPSSSGMGDVGWRDRAAKSMPWMPSSAKEAEYNSAALWQALENKQGAAQKAQSLNTKLPERPIWTDPYWTSLQPEWVRDRTVPISTHLYNLKKERIRKQDATFLEKGAEYVRTNWSAMAQDMISYALAYLAGEGLAYYTGNRNIPGWYNFNIPMNLNTLKHALLHAGYGLPLVSNFLAFARRYPNFSLKRQLLTWGARRTVTGLAKYGGYGYQPKSYGPKTYPRRIYRTYKKTHRY